MGFLDNLLSKNAKRLISDVARAATDAVSNELGQSIRDTIHGNNTTDSAPATPYSANRTDSTAYTGNLEVDEKLRNILKSEFPQYEVREEVSPETLGGTGKFLPYSFGVYENGAPKLFIMVVYNNTCADRLYRWSKEEAEKAGVTLINFVHAFENREDYIINRLHQYL